MIFFPSEEATPLAPARRSGIPAAARVPECSQSAAGQGHDPSEGSGDSRCFGSQPVGDLRAVLDRERGAGDSGWSSRHRRGDSVLRGLVAAIPSDSLPPEADLRLNLPILLVMLAVTTLAGLLFGCAPAWYASRLDPAGVLKGRRALRNRRGPPPAPPIVRDRRIRIGPSTARWSRVSDSQLLESHPRGSRRADRHILRLLRGSPPLLKDSTQGNINAYYARVLAAISKLFPASPTRPQ